MSRKPTLTPERQAELLRRYPHEPNSVLAADFGISSHKACNIASAHGVTKTHAALSVAHSAPDSVASAVRNAAQARGQQGMSRHEAIAALPELAPGSICAALRLEAERGRLHRAGRCRAYRWFTEPADALAHNAASYGSALASFKPPATGGPARSDAAATHTATTRLTKCPPTGWRAQADPPTDGLFKNLKPGRYIDAEAKPWITAATTKGQKA